MYIPARSTPENETWASRFVASMRAMRPRAESLVVQQSRWEQAEASLNKQLQDLCRKLESQQAQAAARIHELETWLAKAQEGIEVAVDEAGAASHRPAMTIVVATRWPWTTCRARPPRNSELQQQVVKLRAANTSNMAVGRPVGGMLGSEAEKRRILAVLESQVENTAEHRAERLEIENVNPDYR